jgi:uroporphyrinogen decarboxylase
MAKEVARYGADFVFTGDDYASAERPFMSPKTFRELFYPGLKSVMAGFKSLGLGVIKHSDGNIRPLLDMILDTDIDCLDPIDPIAGLDIGEMKQKYGQRVALKGNVDCAHTLTFGTEQEVVQETRQVIRKAAAGGGLIVSSSNSIHSGVKPGNYLAMWNAIRMYGQYPIALDSWTDSATGATFS